MVNGKKPLSNSKIDITTRWHNIGKSMLVNTSSTFRIITVAIGILVAVLIAVTLWVRMPEPATPDSSFVPRQTLPFTAKAFLRIFATAKSPV